MKNLSLKNEKFLIRVFNQTDSVNLFEFFKMCLPELGRNFEPDRAHASLLYAEKNYEYFICLIEQESMQILGTSAFKRNLLD